MSIMNAWRNGHVFNNYSSVIATKDFEFIDLSIFPKTKTSNESMLILEVFGRDIDYYQTNIYLNFVPSVNFVACAQAKEVERIVYWGKDIEGNLKNFSNICSEFKYNLGMAIDLLTIIDK